jgi:tRNA dimethylallyltransferase
MVAAPSVVAVVGPTASGKSALAWPCARARGGEIVSCDSLQVYRGSTSAAPRPPRRSGARSRITSWTSWIRTRTSPPPTTRGSPRRPRRLAARGRCRSWPAAPACTSARCAAGSSRARPATRPAARLEAIAERGGDARLHRLLARVDPEAAARIEARDRVRVIRALEVYRASGRPLSAHHREDAPAPDGRRWLVVGLARRATRCGRRWRRGRAHAGRGPARRGERLLARYGGADLRPLRAIGYRQAVAVVRGTQTVDDASVISSRKRCATRSAR